MLLLRFGVYILPQVDNQPYLLEPLNEESSCDKPRKCAVIDLDETLVHSSFAVSAQTRLTSCIYLLLRLNQLTDVSSCVRQFPLNYLLLFLVTDNIFTKTKTTSIFTVTLGYYSIELLHN